MNVPYNSVLNVTGSYTVSAWVYATTLSGSSGTQTIWDNNPSTSNGDIILQFNNNTLAFGFYNTGGTATLVTTTATYSAGTWYHVVGVYNQSTPLLSIYVNGALAVSGAPSGTPHGNTNADTIGESSWGGQYFGGTIDDVRLYNVALSSAQVWQMYNTGSNLFCWGYNVDQEQALAMAALAISTCSRNRSAMRRTGPLSARPTLPTTLPPAALRAFALLLGQQQFRRAWPRQTPTQVRVAAAGHQSQRHLDRHQPGRAGCLRHRQRQSVLLRD